MRAAAAEQRAVVRHHTGQCERIGGRAGRHHHHIGVRLEDSSERLSDSGRVGVVAVWQRRAAILGDDPLQDRRMRACDVVAGEIHGPSHYLTNSRRGKSQNVSTPVSVMRIGSEIEMPQSSSQMPGMKWMVIFGSSTVSSVERSEIVRSPQSGG